MTSYLFVTSPLDDDKEESLVFLEPVDFSDCLPLADSPASFRDLETFLSFGKTKGKKYDLSL